MGWNRWNWLRDAALPMCFSLLRTCWLWPWVELVRRWLAPSQPSPLLPLPLMVGLVLCAMALSRRAAGTWRLIRGRVVVAGAGLLAILLVLWWRFYWPGYWAWQVRWVVALGMDLTRWRTELPGPVIGLAAASYLWLQGVQDGSKSLNSDEAWAAFASCLVSLVFALITAALDGRGAPAGTVEVVVLAFAAGMGALAVSNLELARAAGLQDEAQGIVSRYWLGSVIVVIASLLGLGVLLSLLVAPEALAEALSWVSALLDIVGRVLLTLLLAVAYVTFLLLTPLLNWLIDWLRSVANMDELAEQVQMPDLQQQLEELRSRTAPGGVGIGEAARWLGLAALVLAIGLAFALALRRLRRGEQEGVQETRETVFSGELLRDQVATLWHEWLGRLRGRPRPVLSPFLSLEGEMPTRRLVRAAYQALLGAATARGRPRLRGQTPAEYQRSLEATRLGADDALGTITEAYERARYAPEPPTPEEAQRARRAWEQLRPRLEERGSNVEERGPAGPEGGTESP